MPHLRRLRKTATSLVLLLLISALSFSACRGNEDGLLVFAAASLSDVLAPLGDTFSEEQDVSLRFSFGGSSTLAQQILRGAPADLFIPAGSVPIDSLASRDLILPASRTALLTNELVVVGGDNTRRVSNLHELLSSPDTRLTIADPQLAPAGEYARAALESLDLWDQVQSRLVLGANVRTVLAYVERGDVDAGIVYRTDALGRDKLQVLFSLPEWSYPKIIYPAVVLREARHPEAAAAFVAFLQAPAAQTLFRQQGWVVLELDPATE